MKKSKKTKIQQIILVVSGMVSIFASSLVAEHLPVSQHVRDILFAALLVLGVALLGWAMKKRQTQSIIAAVTAAMSMFLRSTIIWERG